MSAQTATIPAQAQPLAVQLAALFTTDQQIVFELNDAHHRLAAANDRLRTGRGLDAPVIHEQIRHAFFAYQKACEQRRQLAVTVGELSAALTAALTAAGHTVEQARSANVHQLAAGAWQPATQRDHR